MAFDLGQMSGLVKQAQEMQKRIAELQAELAGRTVSAAAGGGMVTATANGASELVALKFEREVVNPDDLEMLSDLVLAACNEALKKAQDMVSQEMNKLTGGLNIPGLFGG